MKYPQPPLPPPLPLCKVGSLCAYAADPECGAMVCFRGSGSCQPPELLSAEPSLFHDKTLIKVTAKVNRIMAAIPADPQGRKPALLMTKKGILLAWIYHENKPAGNYSVTAESDEATQIKALKLKV